MNSSRTPLAGGPSPAPTWQHLPFELDGGRPARGAIGLIALANDVSVEPELNTFLTGTGVALYTNRIAFPDAANLATLAAMERDIGTTTALINPGERLDVVLFGCTSGTMAIGDAVVRERILAARPDVHTSDPISAGIAGLRRLGCRRVAVLTPYIDEVNAVVAQHLEARGLIPAVCASFNRESSFEIARISPQSIYQAGLGIGRRDVDGLFISCTAVHVSPILEQLETDLGKPVVASNQALAWHALRLAGCEDAVSGYGRLLRTTLDAVGSPAPGPT